MKWFIPKEHGAWAMLIVPFLIGMIISEITWYHLIFFIGVLAFYFSSGPLLAFVRKPKLFKEIVPSLLIYLFIGLLFTVPILIIYPTIFLIGVWIVPFFLINIFFAKRKKERLFINDLFAISGLSFLVLISYYIGANTIDQIAFLFLFINIVFFTASVFHVKTLIREKGNNRFLWFSNLFHGLTLVIFLLIGMPFIFLAMLFSSLKAWFLPKNKHYKPIKIGLIEIANSIYFVALIAIFY